MPVLKLGDYKGFFKFAQLQADTSDSDPHVQVWTEVARARKMRPDQKLWMTMLYMAYYQDGSMWFAMTEKKLGLPPLDLPISYQRRNLFGGRIERHLQDLVDKAPLLTYLKADTWDSLLKKLQSIYGNGRWASYTTAEMIVAMGLGPKPETFEIAGSSGPKQGLEFLNLEGTERAAEQLHNKMRKDGLDVPPEKLESFLCNWSRMCKGDFYAGYNLDRQQARLLKIERLKDVKFKEPWEARKAVLPKSCLGEHQGWEGVDKKRIKHYAKTGEVLTPWENR